MFSRALGEAFFNVKTRYDGRELRRAREDFQQLEGQIARAGQAAGLLTARFRNAAFITIAASAGITKVFADVEAAQVNLRRVTDISGDGFRKLSKDVKRLSSSLGLTEEQALSLAAQASKLGISGTGLVSFVETAQMAATALNQDLEVTSDQLGRLRANLDLPVRDLRRLTGAVVQLDNVSASAFPEILDFMLRVGPTAKNVGLAGQNLAAVAAVLTEVGIKSERGGTAVQKILQSLTRNAQELAPLLGMTTNQLVNMDPLQALVRVSQAFATVRRDPERLDQLLKALALDGSRASEVLTVLGTRTGRLQELLKAANVEFDRGRELTRLFTMMTKTLAFTFSQVKSEVLGAAAAIGERMRPVVEAFAKGIIAVARAVKESPFLQFAVAFGLVATAMAAVAGFAAFFAASTGIAIKVALEGLPVMKMLWHQVTGAILGANAAASSFATSSAAAQVAMFQKNSAALGVREASAMTLLFAGANAKRGRGGFLGAMGSAAKELGSFGVRLLPLLARLAVVGVVIAGVMSAITRNTFGARDALQEMIEPFKRLFSGEGKESLRNFMDLLGAITKLLGGVIGLIIRLAAEVLTPIIKALVWVIEKALWLVNAVGDKLNLGGATAAGEVKLQRGSSPEPEIRTVSLSPSFAPSASQPVTIHINNPTVRKDDDLRSMEDQMRRVVRQELNTTAASAGAT